MVRTIDKFGQIKAKREAAAHARQLALRLTSAEDRELALRFAAELDAQGDALERAAEAAWRPPVVQVQGQVQQQSGSSTDDDKPDRDGSS